MLLPLTPDAIRKHLTGKQTIVIYSLLPDETCWFLAVDFDKKSWMADAAAFLETCRQFQVPALVERSRSGNGAHVWMFFDRTPIVLLHGFPDDVRAWDAVTPPLVRAGYRILVPYLRGYGRTRFRDAAASRMAEQAAIGQDLIDLADALQVCCRWL
jgi:pimeloyl-ACP methyl ester carboxylesterase